MSGGRPAEPVVFPLEPLIRFLELDVDTPRWAHGHKLWAVQLDTAEAFGFEEMAFLNGVSRRTMMRWQKAGGLTLSQADRAAVARNVHPRDIWPDEWAQVALGDQLRILFEELAALLAARAEWRSALARRAANIRWARQRAYEEAVNGQKAV
jgi:hypothetical protein